jgi:hypothetical protein
MIVLTSDEEAFLRAFLSIVEMSRCKRDPEAASFSLFLRLFVNFTTQKFIWLRDSPLARCSHLISCSWIGGLEVNF